MSIGNTATVPIATIFADSRHKNKVFIPYLGASYDLNDNLTAYTSYTTIFRPQVRNLDRNGKPLEPQRGKTYELGLKASWFEGRLNASAARLSINATIWGKKFAMMNINVFTMNLLTTQRPKAWNCPSADA